MKQPSFLSGSRLFIVFWTAISLGSCMSMTTVNQQYVYTDYSDNGCGPFKRTVRLGHNKPHPPAIDPTRLSHAELEGIIFDYTEQLKNYLDKEERFLTEDIVRHNSACSREDVFQK